MRERIINAEYTPGTRLPTIHELAAQYNTSYFTVQSALTPLVKDGLIERQRRNGMVVARNPSVLTCAAIYCASGLLDHWEYSFYRELCRQLQHQLAEQNVLSEIFLDSRPQEGQRTPLRSLANAVAAREVQTVIVPMTNDVSNSWLCRLPIASAFVAYDGLPNRVHSDYENMLRLGLQRLHQRGCRTVGLFSTIQTPHSSADKNFKFYESFLDILNELGMATRNAWVKTTRERVVDHTVFGYEAFKALLAQSERPDGLFVFPDISASGVTTAALEMGVRVPDDLRMVFHHNTGVDWLCPLAVDWVEADVAEWAAALIGQVRSQMAGSTVVPVWLKHVIRANMPS